MEVKTQGSQDQPSPYEDRMGVAKDLELLTWRSEGYEYKGIAAAHQERTNASLREATLDIEAREKGDEKEPERRKKGASNQNKKTWNFGTGVEIPAHKATSVRKESSDSTKVGKDHSLKKGKTKERQDGQAKSRDPPALRVRTPKGSIRGTDQSSSEDDDGKKKHQTRRWILALQIQAKEARRTKCLHQQDHGKDGHRADSRHQSAPPFMTKWPKTNSSVKAQIQRLT